MKVVINGKQENIEAVTVKDIVDARELDTTGLIIEHNGKIIKQENWGSKKLDQGDILELLSFVGGG
jgi:sulfur carrier protein